MKIQRRRTFTIIEGESSTHQSFKNECDINIIMSKYKKTGQILHMSQHTGAYGDFTGIGEYQESLNKIILADESFANLPASLRKRFANSPENFIEFILDEKNKTEAENLGLVPKKQPQNEVLQTTGKTTNQTTIQPTSKNDQKEAKTGE